MNNTTVLLLHKNVDDTVGAIIYIIVVLSWYSLGTVCLLGMQLLAPIDVVESSFKYSTQLYSQNSHEKTNKELVDKEKRAKLWNIYWGTSKGMHDRIIHADTLRIHNIQRQLATINDNERIQSLSHADSFHSTLKPSFNGHIRRRSQSLVDQQIIEKWRATVNSLKTQESLPWSLPRFFLRRNLRRQQYNKDYPI
ncbi:unnamed protein product [Adineta steineri]|uniref:Uncharacterized protein n=2 Tax=Adineta steineri TaxID=433720 RepID=A0A818M288_9BILA|nr:unnamed protein product [Adineta steineri]